MIRDIEQLYRHDYGRKQGVFESNERPVKIPAKDAKELGIFDASEDDIEGTFDKLWSNHQMIFILIVEGKHWLVNTEGYDYCRYIVPCVIVEDDQQV